MGNDTSCSRLCEKDTSLELNHEDILTTEYIVPCQICNEQFKHQALKQHIDLKHYAAIKEETDGSVLVQCLLCNKVSSDLIDHGHHIKDKHPYADTPQNKGNKSAVVVENAQSSKIVGDWELNRTKKSTVQKLQNEKDFQIVKKIEENHLQASVQGIKYEVLRFMKEYRGADYYEQLVQAQLVWFNIFNRTAKCRYYFLDLEPGQRNILCKAYLFMANQA